MTTEITITTEKRMIEAGDYTITVTTSARDFIRDYGIPFTLDFKVRKVGTRWHIRPVDESVFGKSMWSVESLKAAEERIVNNVRHLVTPADPLMAGLTFHRNSGAYLCWSGTMEIEGDIAYVYVSRQPGPVNQPWTARVSITDFTSNVYGLEVKYEGGPSPVCTLQKALSMVEERRKARTAPKPAVEVVRTFVVACDGPSEEIEPVTPAGDILDQLLSAEEKRAIDELTSSVIVDAIRAYRLIDEHERIAAQFPSKPLMQKMVEESLADNAPDPVADELERMAGEYNYNEVLAAAGRWHKAVEDGVIVLDEPPAKPATEVTVKVTIESCEPPFPGSITYTVKDEAPDQPPQPRELPEEAQKAVGYLQEIIAFLECGVALSETQQKVYDKALRMAEFEGAATEYGSLAVLKDDDTFFIAGEDEDFEDEDDRQDDDPDYYDDYGNPIQHECTWRESLDEYGDHRWRCRDCGAWGGKIG